ncbi:MAG: Uncharacterized protein JWP12_1514 [Bacteroidetes bacterium]|nr:Uncharacterized protein [Bacteroidota bacterium]
MVNKFTVFSAKSLTAFCIFIAVTAFTVPAHRFYLGLTEIRVSTSKKTMDVSCKLFTDDLEEVLLKKYGKKTDLATSTKDKATQALLNKYINENFKINVGGKLQVLSFVGYEVETDATWCYLETVPFNSKGTINIYNTLLYDYLPEQSNMINFYWDDQDKSAKITNPDKMVEITF